MTRAAKVDQQAGRPELGAAEQPDRVSVEVRATHEVVAARAAELALLVVQFVAATRTPAPVFARRRINVGGGGTGWGAWIRRRVDLSHAGRIAGKRPVTRPQGMIEQNPNTGSLPALSTVFSPVALPP
jgi:hypothetical protein